MYDETEFPAGGISYAECLEISSFWEFLVDKQTGLGLQIWTTGVVKCLWKSVWETEKDSDSA